MNLTNIIKMNINPCVKQLSDLLAVSSTKQKVDYFPIDRFFIEKNGYLEKVLSVDYLEFLFCNLENVNSTYTVQLFVCFPELWNKVTYNNIILLIENFTNSFSFYSLIEFTYKYLKIDLFNEIFYNNNVEIRFKKECISFFLNTFENLYLEEYDYIEFKENSFGISLNQIESLQYKFKNDTNFNPTLTKIELYEKLTKFKEMYDVSNNILK